MDYQEQTYRALDEFLAKAGLRDGQILVIGCSTSEVAGERIGTASSLEIAAQIYKGVQKAITQTDKQIYVAVQCCEHLNRAVVVERECMERYGLDEVTVVPVVSAGGALATYTYQQLSNPVVVETIKAHAGIDIGSTLIGMHLRAVAVPVRVKQRTIGQASVVLARTRPKLIGGERAVYPNLRRCSF